MLQIGNLRRQTWIWAVVAALLATGLTEGLQRGGLVDRLEHFYSDFWHRLAGVRSTPSQVALVMLDDPTLNEHPDEPLVFWTPHFAKAVGTLRAAGVKLVAIDFLFTGSPERWLAKVGLNSSLAGRNFDQAFRQLINRGQVLLTAFRVGKGERYDDFILPSPDYLLALPKMDMAANIGLANLTSDDDGTVRTFNLGEADTPFAQHEGLPTLSLGAAAAIAATDQDPHALHWQFHGRDWTPDKNLKIRWAGPPGTFHHISFRTLLADDAATLPEVQALKGKVVVIGAGYAGMNDVHPTPYSSSVLGANALMAGPEIQANIIETLLSGHLISEMPGVARGWATFGLLLALAVFFVRAPHWQGTFLIIGLGALLAFLGYVLFCRDVLLPVAHFQLGMVLVLIFMTLFRLTKEERERHRIGAVFGRYLSSQVVSTLMNSATLPELGGQSRRITVLFSDIRNFTTLSEQLTAKEVVEVLNTYFEQACAALQAEGASIDKFIGDAVMAEFGAPMDQADHALRALRAALALRKAALAHRLWMQQRFAGRNLPDFDIGIGLHTGEAVVGNIGSSARMEYTAIGDTVNTASRLEGMTKVVGCAILASKATIEAAGPGVPTGEMHTLVVKGRHEPVEAYEVTA